jgi:hypothetical protein
VAVDRPAGVVRGVFAKAFHFDTSGAMMGQWWDWIDQNEGWVWAVSVLSVLMFVGTLVAIPIMIVRMPDDYFVRQPIRDWPSRHPAAHIAMVVLKNFVGLTMLLIGITLVDFPGKRPLERWVIAHRPIHQAANWIRHRYGRPPLRLFQPGFATDSLER